MNEDRQLKTGELYGYFLLAERQAETEESTMSSPFSSYSRHATEARILL